MPNFKAIGTFVAGYFFSDCVEKDYVLKPVLCTIVCAIGTAYGAKITYESASISYKKFVKPALKIFLANQKKE